MISDLKKIWKDPVWSKVIAAIIMTVLLAVVGSLSGINFRELFLTKIPFFWLIFILILPVLVFLFRKDKKQKHINMADLLDLDEDGNYKKNKVESDYEKIKKNKRIFNDFGITIENIERSSSFPEDINKSVEEFFIVNNIACKSEVGGWILTEKGKEMYREYFNEKFLKDKK